MTDGRGSARCVTTACATAWTHSAYAKACCATGLSPRSFGDDAADRKMRAEVWRDRDAVIGGSDAGAHLDMMCGAIYTTSLLGHGAREPGGDARGSVAVGAADQHGGAGGEAWM